MIFVCPLPRTMYFIITLFISVYLQINDPKVHICTQNTRNTLDSLCCILHAWIIHFSNESIKEYSIHAHYCCQLTQFRITCEYKYIFLLRNVSYIYKYRTWNEIKCAGNEYILCGDAITAVNIYMLLLLYSYYSKW